MHLIRNLYRILVHVTEDFSNLTGKIGSIQCMILVHLDDFQQLIGLL